MTTRVHRRLPLVLGITGLVLMLTGCRPYKQDAISLLSDALTSYTWSASDKQHIKKSISRIGDALESENWIDNTHLTSDGGKTVFKTDAKAVIELQKVNAGSLTVINDAIADLTQGDLGVAGTLVQDAENTPTANAAEVALAETAWENAFTAFGASDNLGVLYYSEQAWQHAWNALH